MSPDAKRGDLTNRRIRVAASVRGALVGARILAPGSPEAGMRSGVTVGPEGSHADLALPSWTQPLRVLISGGTEPSLHLQPGMRVHMCHDEGEDRLVGTFEELARCQVSMPIPVRVSKLNIRVAEGISVFVHYLVETDGGGPGKA